jgi:hypothetical protein
MAGLISNWRPGVVPSIFANGLQMPGDQPGMWGCVTTPSVQIIHGALVIRSPGEVLLDQLKVAHPTDIQP